MGLIAKFCPDAMSPSLQVSKDAECNTLNDEQQNLAQEDSLEIVRENVVAKIDDGNVKLVGEKNLEPAQDDQDQKPPQQPLLIQSFDFKEKNKLVDDDDGEATSLKSDHHPETKSTISKETDVAKPVDDDRPIIDQTQAGPDDVKHDS